MIWRWHRLLMAVGTGKSGKYVRTLLPENNPDMPVIPSDFKQIAGRGLRIWPIILQIWDITPLNWNLGCPYPRWPGKKEQRGSGYCRIRIPSGSFWIRPSRN
ncbi:MAG: hypothetical protein R2861_02230 [Desulfobacterales bacterium]